MSFPATLAEYVTASLESYGAAYTRAMMPQLIEVGLDQDLSGAEMLRQIRAAGLGIRTQSFYSLLNTVSEAQAEGETWLAMDPATVPSESDYINMEVTRGTGFLTRMEVLVEDSAGTRTWLPRAFKTYEPVAPGALMQDMSDYFTQPTAEGGEAYEESFLGIRLTGLYKLVPAA